MLTDQVNTLEGLGAALRARYQGKLVHKDAKQELRILKRQASETPEDYGLWIQNLTRTAYPGDAATQEEEGVSAFLRGLPDQKTAEMLSIHLKDMMQDCDQTLAETEWHRTSVGRTQGPLRLRQMEEQQEAPKTKAKGSPTRATQASATDVLVAEVEKRMGEMEGHIEG